MAFLEIWKCAQVGNDGGDARELGHVHSETFSIVHLWHKEDICQGEDIALTVLGTRLGNGLLKSGESSRDCELGPTHLVALPETG